MFPRSKNLVMPSLPFTQHRFAGRRCLSLATLFWGLASAGFAADAPTPTTETRSASGWSSVVVQTNTHWTFRENKHVKAMGGYVYRHLPLIDSVAVRLPSKNLARLAALPFVSRLSKDLAVRKTDEFTVGASFADVAHSQFGLTGAGVTVAVIDSGVREQTDLNAQSASRVLARVSFVPGANPDDGNGHGTHVAGIIAGDGTGSTGPGYFRTFHGIARQASLVSVRVLDAQGGGAVSNVVAGIQWAVDNQSVYNIRVINLSLGHDVGESYTTDPLCRAVERAWQAGIVVVCAAGNTGRMQPVAVPLLNNEGYGTAYGSIQSPGNSPRVITVGAMKPWGGGRTQDRIGTYSARGPSRLDRVLKPDLVAPGNRVISLNTPGAFLPATHSTNQLTGNEFSTNNDPADSSKYFRLSGTSMAAPVVSGAVALMLQAEPGLSPDTVKARLMFAADKWGFPDGSGDLCTFGAGYLNIPAALNQTVVATHPALSPSLWRSPLGSVLINLDGLLIGNQGIWGTGVQDLSVVWGSHALWGDNTVGGTSTVGSSGVWTNNAVWSVINGYADLSWIVIHGEE